jgi:hypothetical protein
MTLIFGRLGQGWRCDCGLAWVLRLVDDGREWQRAPEYDKVCSCTAGSPGGIKEEGCPVHDTDD